MSVFITPEQQDAFAQAAFDIYKKVDYFLMFASDEEKQEYWRIQAIEDKKRSEEELIWMLDSWIKTEYEKCVASPYYWATRYLRVDGGMGTSPFTTHLSEDEFNKIVRDFQAGKAYLPLKFRNRATPYIDPESESHIE